MRLEGWGARANLKELREEAELDRILRAGSKTFYFASLVLPRRIRRPTLALYAFCRHADDDVDEASDRGRARAAVDSLRARIERVYSDRSLDDIVERRFSAVVQRYGIPRREPELLAEGMEWDVEGRHYPTLDTLRAYALRVAGTVGVMMTYIMGKSEPRVLARARDLGIGMQLTNIARDVGTDARMGRVYLPLDWLSECGSSAEELLSAPRATPPVRRCVSRLLNIADVHYERADEGIAHLPGDCRVSIRAARLIYAEIGAVVRARECDSVSSRAVVSLRRKTELLAQSLEARFWRPRALEDVRAESMAEAS
jgi:phytoene synthase